MRRSLDPDFLIPILPRGPGARSFAAPTPIAEDPLRALIASLANREGCNHSLFPGLHFYRVTQPVSFKKTTTFGPTLTVAVQGRKQVWFGTHELFYDPAHYLVVTEESSFEGRVTEASPERPYLAVCIEIPPKLVAKLLLALSDAAAEPPASSTPAPAFVSRLDDPIKTVVERLVRASTDPIERRIVAPLVLEELIFRLLRSEAAQLLRRAVGRDRDGESIREAMRFMRANATRALSVEMVAKQVAMSPSHFAHRFREIARVSPMRFLKRLRLSEARTLMLQDGVRVGEAAARVGYESASHFTRDFRSYFGASPADYMRRLRRGDSQDRATKAQPEASSSSPSAR